MTKAQQVYERIEALVASGLSKAEAFRHLAEEHNKKKGFLRTILDACTEVARPSLFGKIIIIVVYLPILSLQGVEGKMFRPMALTVVFALIGSLIITFLLTPVLMSLFMRKPVDEKDVWLIRKSKEIYQPKLEWTLSHGRQVLIGSRFVTAWALH